MQMIDLIIQFSSEFSSDYSIFFQNIRIEGQQSNWNSINVFIKFLRSSKVTVLQILAKALCFVLIFCILKKYSLHI